MEPGDEGLEEKGSGDNAHPDCARDGHAPAGAVAAAGARLWDLPVRLVHWMLVAVIAVAWWSAETERMELHRSAGYVALGLVVFRLAWGFAGSDSARFTQFVRGPAATFAHLKALPSRKSSEVAGHNPLGALSVLATCRHAVRLPPKFCSRLVRMPCSPAVAAVPSWVIAPSSNACRSA